MGLNTLNVLLTGGYISYYENIELLGEYFILLGD